MYRKVSRQVQTELLRYREEIMPIIDGVFEPLTLDEALSEIISDAPASIVFTPGNPPELILANMFAQASINIDENEGEIMAMMMSPVGAMIDLMNPNNVRKDIIAATGYITVTNPTGVDIVIPAGTICLADNGQEYVTGSLSVTVEDGETLNVTITAVIAGVSGNISANSVFTITGYGDLTPNWNPLPLLNGDEAESDAIYLNRITKEKTQYGAQNGSVAVETEIKKYYPDAVMYVNNTSTGLTDPVPVPVNGYNLVVKTPSGILADATEILEIFNILSERLEFVNSQNTSSDTHIVLSGSITTGGVPLSYFFTVAQVVDMTLDITINVYASESSETSELIIQANSFAISFINRLMQFFSGIDGKTDVIYDDGVNPPETTTIDISGISAQAGTIAPAFGIGSISALVSDIDTMGETPNIVFDSVDNLTIVIDPEVYGEADITLELGGATTFIDFASNDLFSDSTSYFDRFAFIDPEKLTITVAVVGWI